MSHSLGRLPHLGYIVATAIISRNSRNIARLTLLGFKHLSPEERHVIYKKLWLRVSARPDGAMDIEGSFGTNILPTEKEIVPESLTEDRERSHRGESVISLVTATTRLSR